MAAEDNNRNLPGNQEPGHLSEESKRRFDQVDDDYDRVHPIDPVKDLALGEGIGPEPAVPAGPNPFDEHYREALGIDSPPGQQSQQSASGFRGWSIPGRVKKPGAADDDWEKKSMPGSKSEAKSLSDIINNTRDEHLDALKRHDDELKTNRFSKFNFVGRGRRRARRVVLALIISGTAAAAVAVVGIVPQAIDSILTSATTSYSNFSSEGIIKRAFNQYAKETVLLPKCNGNTSNHPALNNHCNVAKSKKNGLFGRAIEDMRANKMDEKLRSKGIHWEYDADNDRYTVFKSKDGNPINADFSKNVDYDGFDMFDMGREEGSKFIDSEVRKAINEESRWKKYFIRGPTVRAMRARTGSTGCFFLCKSKDSYNQKKKWPKRAFAKLVANTLLRGQSDLMNNIADCVIGGGEGCTSRKTRDFLKGKVADAATKMFDEEFGEKLLKTLENADGLSKGATRFVLEEAVKKISSWVTEEVTEKTASNIVGIILLIRSVGKAVSGLIEKLPKVLRVKNMMAIALVSSTFLIMVNESRRGAIPLGDYGQMLSTFIGMGGSRIFANMFMGADNETAKNGQPYNCNNAEEGGVAGAVSNAFSPAKMESGDLTCKSFKLDYTPSFLDNSFLRGIGSAYDVYNNACIGLGSAKVCLDSPVDALNRVEGFLGSAFQWVLEKVPGYQDLQKLIAEKSQDMMQNIFTAVSPTIVNGAFAGVGPREGARVFDSIAGGSSANNQYITPRDELGGGALDSIAQAELDTAIAEQQAQDIHYASFYDRFFNLDPTGGVGTSLLTQFAGSAFGNYHVANLVNPLQNLSLAFNNASGSNTFASNGSIASTVSGAFAVPVRGYSLSTIQSAQKGGMDSVDPDSDKCKKEKADWKAQIEDRSDGSDDSQIDALGYGIPDGDGSGTSPCMLVGTALKTVTTHSTDTDDFSMEGDSDVSGSAPEDVPLGGGLGKCSGVPTIRPNEGKDLNDVELQQLPGKNIKILTNFCMNVKNMLEAARADGLELDGGGFRTYDQQVGLRKDHCKGADGVASNYEIYDKPSGECIPHTAKPGTSNHEKGVAIDFDSCHAGSSCFKWLSAHAKDFHFYNYKPESWHWSVTGG